MFSLRRLFARKPDASEAARTLSRIGHERQRERVKAVARQMRADMGLPHAPELDPR